MNKVSAKTKQRDSHSMPIAHSHSLAVRNPFLADNLIHYTVTRTKHYTR